MNQAEKQFNFDLQIFADETADVSTPEVTETAEPAQEPAPAPTDSAPEPEKHISEMTDDEQTEYIKRHFLDDKPSKKEEPKEEPGQVTQPEEKPEEPTFEITVGGEKKQVTQSELIALAQKGEDYTRKTQALAEQRRQLEAQALQFQQMQQRRQPQPPQNPGDRVKAEYNAAVAIAEQQLGLQPGEFNQFDPEHAFMLQNVIIRANMIQGQQMAERNAVASEIRDFSEEIKKDPMTKQVSDAYEEWILRRGLESKEQAQIAQQVAMAYSRFNAGNPTRQDCKVLKEHWAYVKGKIGQPATPPAPQKPIIKPPQTEAPGVGRSASAGGGVMDVRKLRSLSSDPDRQLAYMKSLGIFND